MDDDRSSEDGLVVVGGKVEICEPSIACSKVCHGILTLLFELCIGGAQGKHGSRISSFPINLDSAEVADVSSFVALFKWCCAPWIVVGSSVVAGITKVTELMDVEAVRTFG